MGAEPNKQADAVAGMFTRVARNYDRTNAVLSVGNSGLWRIATVKAVDPRPGERILDIAAGTGTSSAALARSGATVVALDFSPGMIAQGRQRHPQIEFVEADAEKLPFSDDEFDAVTISFGLRNIEHPEVALGEMFRVLKPGGRLVVCEFSKPPHAFIRAGYDVYLKHVLPVVGGITGSDAPAYSYLSDTIDTWPDQGTLSQWIRGVGFARVGYRNLTAGVVALHRGRKPVDPVVRASAAKRAAARRSANRTRSSAQRAATESLPVQSPPSDPS